MTKRLIKRAINSGFKALVLTVDAPTMGRRRDDERNGFELPENLRFDFDWNYLKNYVLSGINQKIKIE